MSPTSWVRTLTFGRNPSSAGPVNHNSTPSASAPWFATHSSGTVMLYAPSGSTKVVPTAPSVVPGLTVAGGRVGAVEAAELTWVEGEASGGVGPGIPDAVGASAPPHPALAIATRATMTRRMIIGGCLRSDTRRDGIHHAGHRIARQSVVVAVASPRRGRGGCYPLARDCAPR